MPPDRDTRDILIPATGSVRKVRQPYYGKSWALVIGINNYQTVSPLLNARNDAEAVARVLRDLYAFEEIHALYDQQATRDTILRWLRDELPDKTDENDRVIIFFAGHGTTLKNRQGHIVGGYLIPFIAKDEPTLYANFIDMDDLRKACHHMPAKHVFIILDCCFSGVAAVAARAAPPSPKSIDDVYLQRITERNAYQILTAGASDELAADSGLRPGHSAFTGALLQGLEGAADHNEDGLITASALATYVAPLVSRETAHAGGQGQTPFFNYLDGSGEGDWVFLLPEQERKVQPVSLPPELHESTRSPLPWVREGAARQLARFLEGDKEGLALAAHIALQGMRDDDSRQVSMVVDEILNAYAEAHQEAIVLENLLETVKAHWHDPSQEAMLAHRWQAATPDERHQATVYLIERGCRMVTLNGEETARSGLRTALHLWGRSGVALEHGETLDLLLEHIYASPHRKVGIARDFHAPADILKELAEDEDADVRRGTAANPNTPAYILEKLARDEDVRVRMDAASNPNISASILKELLLDEYYDVSSNAAANPNMPAGNLKKLAKDDDVRVRWITAGSPNLPADILEELAKDEDVRVRIGAASNPNMLASTLKKLAKDEDYTVRWTAAANPNMPDATLKELVKDEFFYVRWNAAANPNMSADILKELAEDEDADVRGGAAANPNTPAYILRSLAKDGYYDVRDEIASNPNTPADILEELLEEMAKDEDFRIRWITAANPNTSAYILEKLARDEDGRVRIDAAANPNTPAYILERLAKDEDVSVRIGAAENPRTCLEWL
jgi:hypothetical protein